MTHQKEITRIQFYEAMRKYWQTVNQLPIHLQEACPNFEYFLSPAHYSNFNMDYIELSITGTKRYEALYSPHAVTLLNLYAIQHLQLMEAMK